ncbi:COMPASS component SWD2 [Acrasis kona]|uniref:COMPASS component SWD2 n=1 Tax=Acrasis kona TaxID=1008807 RepID=A0AAW2Z7R6_9EUKA
MSVGLRLNSNVLKSFQMGRVLKDNSKEINSLDFSRDGDWLVTASDDESIHLVNCNKGTMDKELFSKKYGVNLIRFTNHNSAVIYASKNESDDSLRYLSVHDNRFIRYFSGHRDHVTSVAMSPNDDTFLSAALDQCIYLWDLRTNTSQGKVGVIGKPQVAYDPQGDVIAVASGINVVKLYDKRHLDGGPFCVFPIDLPSSVDFTHVKFSPSGKLILLSTNDNIILLLDAYKGNRVADLTDFVHDNSTINIEASFTPDEQYIVSGSEDGSIHFWDIQTKQKCNVLKGHAGPVTSVQCNPRFAMLASACTNLALWVPTDRSQ